MRALLWPAGKPVGTETTLRFRKGEQLVERDTEKLLAFAIDKASFALLESKGFPELEVGDPEAAQELSRVLGREAGVGESIALDGHWTPELKRFVFNWNRNLLSFVNTKADELSGFEAEAEDELGKT